MSGNVYAAIDLGTNNCRLLVALVKNDTFRVIDSFSRIVRLGEGLSRSDQFNEEAVERTIEALHVCAEKMQFRGVGKSRSIATEACRRAADCDAFYKRALGETGIELETISPEQEAQLTLDGCAQLLDRDTPRAIVFDIGGGSTELMWVERSNTGEAVVLAMLSLPIGVVTLVEQHGSGIIERHVYEEIIARVEAEIQPFDRQHGISDYLASHATQLLGTSGTVTTLGGLYLNLPRYNRAQVDGLNMRVETISAISERLAGMNHDERAQNGCIGPERADLVVMGCAILDAICRHWPAPTIRAADRGIREGLLMGLIKANGDTFTGAIT
ncbi:MAG: Ppx/GppA family phosphatase [Rhodospirillaceae bacterium]|jgi:exopolyphosphatase / guanosine-5'-triphosphate,3'-diphosphate pyrophosphatase|nr:Ppx/GppA family phosphatase [Rhodospirillaceae bacterium]MBT5244540.1 Ppx/GppA family phosphatase [Rhodospirillaceae bacterium]MBT5562864.1 Ppx/GppA family phosphatase [Rhodospirillaceae bacterium]MBT6242496.1 Ppx/GppA family phosphatase [Rhodospirillaceae bacterium]MBT7137962.1 Ppx/GppA family phosphatase [Rhodospirillaceae bacterium]